MGSRSEGMDSNDKPQYNGSPFLTGRDVPKSFLPGGVPNLQFRLLPHQEDRLDLKINPLTETRIIGGVRKNKRACKNDRNENDGWLCLVMGTSCET